jgi:hypothetical protein
VPKFCTQDSQGTGWVRYCAMVTTKNLNCPALWGRESLPKAPRLDSGVWRLEMQQGYRAAVPLESCIAPQDKACRVQERTEMGPRSSFRGLVASLSPCLPTLVPEGAGSPVQSSQERGGVAVLGREAAGGLPSWTPQALPDEDVARFPFMGDFEIWALTRSPGGAEDRCGRAQRRTVIARPDRLLRAGALRRKPEKGRGGALLCLLTRNGRPGSRGPTGLA